ncbi:hypothetical protein CDQ91_15700 [Sphingopyxis witflariensis]|uniref:Uncharacterized protein n=2 Tax=Sphingopyxis witflariensis TaxID=173675 RepID=A0A2D0AMY6_9SPHN|nr:hypothetical protein CDQ91_15700 [Sphingopyxis witflariensis]
MGSGHDVSYAMQPMLRERMSETKLNGAEKRARRELGKLFDAAWKREAKAAGWGYLKPTSFKRIDDWFVYLDPEISTERNSSKISAAVKPFAIDDLMSRILGFEGLDGTPLSLRARGPHCLVVPMFSSSIEGDLNRMIELATEFSKTMPVRVEGLTLADFADFSAAPAGHVSAEQVAALILAGEEEEAAKLCDLAIAIKQWGGPARTTADGKIVSFFHFARQWIDEHRDA